MSDMRAVVYDRYGPPAVLRVADVIERHHSLGRLLAGLALRQRGHVLAGPTPTHRLVERGTQRTVLVTDAGVLQPRQQYATGVTCARKTLGMILGMTDFCQPDSEESSVRIRGYAGPISLGR
jgi:hypothetical protein